MFYTSTDRKMTKNIEYENKQFSMLKPFSPPRRRISDTSNGGKTEKENKKFKMLKLFFHSRRCISNTSSGEKRAKNGKSL